MAIAPARSAPSHCVDQPLDPTNWVVSRLSNPVKFALAASPYPTVPALLADARLKAIETLTLAAGDPWGVRAEGAFTALRDRVRAEAADRMLAVVNTAGEVLQRHQQVQLALPAAPATVRSDVTEQVAGLKSTAASSRVPPIRIGSGCRATCTRSN